MQIDARIRLTDLGKPLLRLFELASAKCVQLDRTWNFSRGAPVLTVEGRYTARRWTQWTQGFQFGCALLAFDATGDKQLLRIARERTVVHMPVHVTHVGVHDHGFNNISTFGNLRRLMREGKIPHNDWEKEYYELAVKCSGAVQAARWAGIRVDQPLPHSANSPQLGYIYSFNGEHSLFIDAMRTTRILGVAWQLGHRLMHENDRSADLLKRSVLHGLATNQHLIFHGDSDHAYDIPGRTAHEGIFNRNDGSFRARSTQQGYSPFSTWTRGLAWAMLGFAEELEFVATIPDAKFRQSVGLSRKEVMHVYKRAATEMCDHYINDCSARDGIVYWDAGAPGLGKLKNWRERDADPFNDHEPVDASASAIAAQGLLRLGSFLGTRAGKRYTRAGLSIALTLLSDRYLATNPRHQGLLLHSVYHRPNGWDHVPRSRKNPCGESSMWGDYHLLELGVYLQRLIEKSPYLAFFDQ